jgi:hypothetical protein
MSELDRDILISRVADGAASDAEWERFRCMAEREPSLWRELAETQRCAAELTAAVGAAVAAADGVEAPTEALMAARFSERLGKIGRWGGWAAAAALALAWATGLPKSGTETASLTGGTLVRTPQDALDYYLDRGQKEGTVLGEAPEHVLIDATPCSDGQGYDVFFMRQIVERTRVRELSKLGVDDAGQVRPVRVYLAPRSRGTY